MLAAREDAGDGSIRWVPFRKYLVLICFPINSFNKLATSATVYIYENQKQNYAVTQSYIYSAY